MPAKKTSPDERRRRAAAKDSRQIPLPIGDEYRAGLVFPTAHRHAPEDGLTKREEKILRMTARLWNAYCKMQPVHPSEMEELQLYIHQIQYLVARRVAKRLEPHVWA
jgi:hypothetical protein